MAIETRQEDEVYAPKINIHHWLQCALKVPPGRFVVSHAVAGGGF